MRFFLWRDIGVISNVSDVLRSSWLTDEERFEVVLFGRRPLVRMLARRPNMLPSTRSRECVLVDRDRMLPESDVVVVDAAADRSRWPAAGPRVAEPCPDDDASPCTMIFG